MTTRHFVPAEVDTELSVPALPQRVPGAALAALMAAEFANALDAFAAQRMPSRAEIEPALHGGDAL